MSVEIQYFVSPTQIVRSVIRAHKPMWVVNTNTSKHYRTVSFRSHNGDASEIIEDIRTALQDAGVEGFSIKTIPYTRWSKYFNKPAPHKIESVIVRIPRTEQP